MSVEIDKENSPVGIDWQTDDKVHAWCGKLKWNLKEGLHIRKHIDKIRSIDKKYDDTVKSLTTSMNDYEIQAKLDLHTKTILELCLEDFDYDKVSNDPEAGPALLTHLSSELRGFLYMGGKRAMQLLQTRLNLEKARRGS